MLILCHVESHFAFTVRTLITSASDLTSACALSLLLTTSSPDKFKFDMHVLTAINQLHKNRNGSGKIHPLL